MASPSRPRASAPLVAGGWPVRLALVTASAETYLFEATPDLRPQLDRVIELGQARGRADQGRRLLDGIFLTHAHMGHYTGLLHLGFEAAHSQGVELFASDKMVAFLHANQPWRGDLTRHIDSNPLCLGKVLPAGAAALDGEVLTVDAR